LFLYLSGRNDRIVNLYFCMKKAVLFSLTLALAATSAFAQQKPATKTVPAATQATPVSGAQITFEKTKFDFGTVTEGDKVEHTFAFKNTGTEPLILSNVQTTCGCTVPQWPKEPIMPGQSGEIKATFNTTGKGGQQNKVVTIISNAKEGNSQVALVGNVKAKATTGTTGQAKPATGHEGHSH
jgi:phage tail tube protein FII